MAEVFTYASPESVGIPSAEIEACVQDLENQQLYMHSFMVVRHGKIVAEGYWKPFHKDFRHRMYSVSKSFVTAAIGLLLDAGKIKLSDRICTYFPEYPEETLHPYIKDTTIRDLLIMATPHELSYSFEISEWVESFFRVKPNKPSGTVFCYDTTASFLLNVLAERLTGKPYMDYLYDEILHKLDFFQKCKMYQKSRWVFLGRLGCALYYTGPCQICVYFSQSVFNSFFRFFGCNTSHRNDYILFRRKKQVFLKKFTKKYTV